MSLAARRGVGGGATRRRDDLVGFCRTETPSRRAAADPAESKRHETDVLAEASRRWGAWGVRSQDDASADVFRGETEQKTYFFTQIVSGAAARTNAPR